MVSKTLSIFIDESGYFGPYEPHAPYYLVSMIFHNQQKNIQDNIAAFNSHLYNLGYPNHAIHTGPLIRRESIYINDFVEERRQLFNALFHFARKLDFQYACVKVKKSKCPDIISLNGFENIIVYYDNGQIELTKILSSVFHTLYTHLEFRKVQPVDYKLFQVADLICTMELLAEKAEKNDFTRSEKEFFDNVRNFKKNYLKHIRKKELQ